MPSSGNTSRDRSAWVPHYIASWGIDMGRYTFRLPDVGEGTAEAEIMKWHVAVGDTIDEDQPLVDVATDKAVVEIPAPVGGKVIAVNGAPGDTMPVGCDLVVFETSGA